MITIKRGQSLPEGELLANRPEVRAREGRLRRQRGRQQARPWDPSGPPALRLVRLGAKRWQVLRLGREGQGTAQVSRSLITY